MKHFFVPYKIAFKLKELGFNESCFAEYRQWDGNIPYLGIYQDDNAEDSANFTTECLAPLYQQVIDWLREEYEIIISIEGYKDMDHCINYNVKILKHVSIEPLINKKLKGLDILEEYPTKIKTNTDYYKVLIQAIEEAIKLIEK